MTLRPGSLDSIQAAVGSRAGACCKKALIRRGRPKRIGLLLVGLTLSACNHYQVTLNDQTLYTPAPLYSDYQIDDPALSTCVSQAIKDQNVFQAKQLTRLQCSFAGVRNLSGIQVFSQLEQINLANNYLTDLKPLLFLGNLKTVNLENNPQANCADVIALKKQTPVGVKTPSHCS